MSGSITFDETFISQIRELSSQKPRKTLSIQNNSKSPMEFDTLCLRANQTSKLHTTANLLSCSKGFFFLSSQLKTHVYLFAKLKFDCWSYTLIPFSYRMLSCEVCRNCKQFLEKPTKSCIKTTVFFFCQTCQATGQVKSNP